ncbi:DMT family transporter [Siculibacillus lacustris]|uniref:DMT family transporter n=1 Tax=Siculibacillus lacustris TaxID=1549641 RepID=UPI0013F1667E|nr:DMT family transporter [Siculibacillus lacustris]
MSNAPLPRPDAAALPRRLQAIGLMCLALFCFTGIDASAKWLSLTLPTLEVSFFRYLVAFLVAAAVFHPFRMPDAWTTRRPWLQGLRGLCLLGSTVFNFLALRHLQLAETMSIFFSAPLLIALVSGPLLGEVVGPRRWAAILVGFLGVLVVAHPSPSHLDPAMLLAFANVGCYVVYALSTRILSTVDSAASMLVISAGIAVVLLAPAMPAIWVWPQGVVPWAVVVLMGSCGAIGHFLIILAFARAPASVVVPFAYSQILWMTGAGWFVFGDVPSHETIIGTAIIAASGLYLIHRERLETRPPAPPATPAVAPVEPPVDGRVEAPAV